jgi:hypothetical protein
MLDGNETAFDEATMHTDRNRPLLTAILFLLFVVTFAPAAFAQGGPGIRGGASLDPDQFYFGAHYETSPLVEHLRFRPNVEVGIGNNLTLVALNFEFAYWIPIRNQPWNLYVGGGPAINVYRVDADRAPFGDNTEAEGGFNFLLGIGHRDGLFFELKVGALDSPDLKFGVGYSFR